MFLKTTLQRHICGKPTTKCLVPYLKPQLIIRRESDGTCGLGTAQKTLNLHVKICINIDGCT